jgi:creatinine amidohydrolase/Fe(II)-dependent formamide hydrolase-like protein
MERRWNAQDAIGVDRPLHIVATVKSSCMAARFEEDSGSANVSWKRAAVAASGVVGDERDADADAGFHLLSITRLAWFFGLGSRYTDLVASQSLW